MIHVQIMDDKTRISFRVDKQLKEDAVKILGEMQLDLTTALNLFLDQVVKQNRLPFSVTNENEEARYLHELMASVERGVRQAQNNEGIDAKQYLAQLKKEQDEH